METIINKSMLFRKIYILLFFSIGFFFHSFSKVHLPRVFSNNMVLQRDKEIKLWGWADSKENITVSFLGIDYATQANEKGEWEIALPSQKASGPFELVIAGTNTIKLQNILFGDVWVCSGQSNMYFRTAAAKNAYLDINKANNKNIRLFQIDKEAFYQPKEDLVSGEWLECNSETVSGFSAVAYFFGKELINEIEVPIGLIHASWGGSSIQAWMNGKSIKKFSDYTTLVNHIEKTPYYFEQLAKIYEDNGGNLIITELYKKDPGFKDNGKKLNDDFFKEEGWCKIRVPGYWENLGIEEYDGTLWYRKQFDFPKAFADKDLILNLGWIDDYDFTFFNGQRIGSTTYKGSERKYTIPKDMVKKGMNEIHVCVYDSGGKGGFWGPRKSNIKIKDDNTLLSIDLQGLWEYKKGINTNDFYTESLSSNKQPSERSVPTFLYNAMISPITNLSIKGAVWYQGESNAGNADEYSELLPAMIKGWRQEWNQGDFPFLIVQLANYGIPDEKPSKSNWAELREAQFKATNLENVGLACTIDIGNEMDIHPTNKQEVGQRLMLTSLKVAYNMDVVYSGPTYKSKKIFDNKVEISFDNIGSGLIAKDKFGDLNEFAIAGVDKKFVWAKAKIVGDKVIVYNEKVQSPVAVRYAWSNNPSQANFYNKEGLPVIPFRTDEWK